MVPVALLHNQRPYHVVLFMFEDVAVRSVDGDRA